MLLFIDLHLKLL